MTLQELENDLFHYFDFFQTQLPAAPIANAINEFRNTPPSYESIDALIQKIMPKAPTEPYVLDTLLALLKLLNDAIQIMPEFQHHHIATQENRSQIEFFSRHDANQTSQNSKGIEYRGRPLKRHQLMGSTHLEDRDRSPVRNQEEKYHNCKSL